MDIYGLNIIGPIKIEEVSTLPAWSASDERRIIYTKDTGKTYYSESSEWIEFGSSSNYNVSSNSVDTTINLSTSDLNKVLLIENASTVTINLPSVDSSNIGSWIKIYKMGAGDINIARADSDTIEDNSTLSNAVSGETFANVSLLLATSTEWKFDGAPLGSWSTS